MMIATVHDPMVQENPRLIQAFVNGLAAASHYTRQNRGEAVAIFAKWVPNVNLDVARKAIQHISYDPRISRQSLQAFENAQNELLQHTIKGAKPKRITDIVLTSYTEAAQRAHPQYFSDLPALSR
jgi:ABC-type nitrate/sulfonate/bicarbonate transport system substrate-binding protein